MSVRLTSPHDDGRDTYDAAEWYLERAGAGDPVDPYLPLFQGDVFVGVPLDGVPLSDSPQGKPAGDPPVLQEAVMLIGHPCSMVAGSVPLTHQEVVRVRPTPSLRYDKYDTERFAEFPLPFLDQANSDLHYSACLRERALVPTELLDMDKRVAVLDLLGVVALQQRITHESSRVKIAESLLREATKPRFDENQHAREWNTRVLGKYDLSGAELTKALAEEAAAYDAAISTEIKIADPASGYVLSTTLRAEMFRPNTEGKVKTAIAKLRAQRKFEVRQQRQQIRDQAAQQAREAAAAEAPAAAEPADATPATTDFGP